MTACPKCAAPDVFQRVRHRSQRPTGPEVGAVAAEPSLFVVDNSPMTTPELRDANLAQMIG